MLIIITAYSFCRVKTLYCYWYCILLLCLLHWLLLSGRSHVLGNYAAVQNVPLVS